MKLDTLENNYKNKRIYKIRKIFTIKNSVFKKKQKENHGKDKMVTLKLPNKTEWGNVTIAFEGLLNKEVLDETLKLLKG